MLAAISFNHHFMSNFEFYYKLALLTYSDCFIFSQNPAKPNKRNICFPMECFLYLNCDNFERSNTIECNINE